MDNKDISKCKCGNDPEVYARYTDGVCYPSIASISCKCGAKVRKESSSNSYSEYEKIQENCIEQWNDVMGYVEEGGAKTRYTEARRYWDGKEPLEVGMVVNVSGFSVEHIVKLPVDAEGGIVVSPIDRDFWQITELEHVKPVDTRTDKEKDIEEFLAEEINIELSHSGRLMLERAYDKWVGSVIDE